MAPRKHLQRQKYGSQAGAHRSRFPNPRMQWRQTICAMPRCGRSFISRPAARRCAFTCRMHLGAQSLHVSSVHIARPVSPSSPAIDPQTDRVVTFAGSADVIVPPGAEYISDALEYPIAALSDLAVSFHLDTAPTGQTAHPGSRATSYFVHGNFVSAANLIHPKRVDHWYQISAIDVEAPPGAASVVALGDSITDGHGATHQRQ